MQAVVHINLSKVAEFCLGEIKFLDMLSDISMGEFAEAVTREDSP